MDIRDVLKRPVKRTTRVSEYKEGRWSFIFLEGRSPSKVTPEQTYYRLNNKFGTATVYQTNPKQTASRGKPGDYIGRDTLGNVSVISAAEYLRLFPIPNQKPPTPAVTSDALKDPNVLTETFKKLKKPVSNTMTTKPTPTTKGY